MLQPHSVLWHYLWVGPCVILGFLAYAMAKRGLHRQYPVFFSYVVFEAVGGGLVYGIDVSPSVFSDATYWRTYLAFLIVEAVIKFVVVGEVFTHLLHRYPPLGSFAKLLVSGLGVVLAFAATIIAAYASPTPFWLISATRILSRSVSVVECGMILSLFAFASHFHLRWERACLGITLGFAINASTQLAYWALMTGWLLGLKSYLLDFGIMAAYHLCVLIWIYYLLVPQKKPTTSTVSLPENNLAVWNRELERLLQ